jgi:hypothetical protein
MTVLRIATFSKKKILTLFYAKHFERNKILGRFRCLLISIVLTNVSMKSDDKFILTSGSCNRLTILLNLFDYISFFYDEIFFKKTELSTNLNKIITNESFSMLITFITICLVVCYADPFLSFQC